MYRIVLSVITFLFTISCSDDIQRVYKNEFPQKIKLTAKKISIDEIVRPVEIVVHNEFLIIQNDQIPNMPCFYVYSIDSLTFLYSFGFLGGSEEEYVAPLISRDDGNDLFSVFDQRTRYLKRYKITKNEPIMISNEKINEKTNYPFQEMSFVNDSIFLYLSVDNKIMSYNLKNESIVDTIVFETSIKDKLNLNYKQSLDFFHFSISKNKIVTGHNFIDILTLNECSGDGKFKKHTISLTNENIQYFHTKLYDNTYFYAFVETTDKLIFAQYSGYRFKLLQPFPLNLSKRHLDFLYEVYNWDLTPKALIELDNDFYRCTIDKYRNKLYTWNPLEDFDYLYVYDYSEIIE